jgi:hypothetical protein
MKLKVVNYSKMFNETWICHVFLGIHNYTIDKDDLNVITVYRR